MSPRSGWWNRAGKWESRCGGVLQRCLIGPSTVTAELGFDVSPNALYPVQIGSIDRQLQRTHSVVMGHPPVLGKPNLVVADIVQDHHERP
jgi:hypothetical protein